MDQNACPVAWSCSPMCLLYLCASLHEFWLSAWRSHGQQLCFSTNTKHFVNISAKTQQFRKHLGTNRQKQQTFLTWKSITDLCAKVIAWRVPSCVCEHYSGYVKPGWERSMKYNISHRKTRFNIRFIPLVGTFSQYFFFVCILSHWTSNSAPGSASHTQYG